MNAVEFSVLTTAPEQDKSGDTFTNIKDLSMSVFPLTVAIALGRKVYPQAVRSAACGHSVIPMEVVSNVQLVVVNLEQSLECIRHLDADPLDLPGIVCVE